MGLYPDIFAQRQPCRHRTRACWHKAMAEHALARQDDLIAFAPHAIHHHSAFDRHPRVQAMPAIFKPARPTEEIDYRELSSGWSAVDWQEIRQTMPSHPPVRAPATTRPPA